MRGVVRDWFITQHSVSKTKNPVPTDDQCNMFLAIAQKVIGGDCDITVSFDEQQIGHCHKGKWKWNVTICNRLHDKQSMNDSAWQRFDYIWTKISDNLMWHPGFYRETEIDSNGWSTQSDQKSAEFLMLILLLGMFVWQKGKMEIHGTIDLEILKFSSK